MKNTAAGVPFILICVLLDILGIGLIIPVLPQLVGDLAGSQSAQAWWLGAMLIAYGLMQFCFAPTLGALSDRYGRRPSCCSEYSVWELCSSCRRFHSRFPSFFFQESWAVCSPETSPSLKPTFPT